MMIDLEMSRFKDEKNLESSPGKNEESVDSAMTQDLIKIIHLLRNENEKSEETKPLETDNQLKVRFLNHINCM